MGCHCLLLAQVKRVQKRGSQDWRGTRGNGLGEAMGRGVLSGKTQGQFMEGKPRWVEAGQQNLMLFFFLNIYLLIYLCIYLFGCSGS